MRAFDFCPVCKIPMEPSLHSGSYDGNNYYDCRNTICGTCPISFTEGSFNGILKTIHFQIDDQFIVCDYENNKLIINPSYPFVNFRNVYHYDLIINHIPQIDWSNLEKLRHKLKTYILFS